MPDLTQEAKAVLDRLHLSPKKRLGQHFMVSGEALTWIAEALSVSSDETVVEIGPGLGFLTRLLARKTSRLIAVEKDRAFAGYLTQIYKGGPVKILEADVLKLDLERDFAFRESVKVAGNIPYNITSPILEWLISQRMRIRQAVLTVQSEVAERLAARPGNRCWGSLSAFVQVYSRVSVVRKISRQSFWPAPRVDSAVVRFDLSPEPLVAIRDEAKFFGLIRRAFQKRRKTVLNALAGKKDPVFAKPRLAGALAQAGINPQRRPETLSLEEWARLAPCI